MAAKTYIIPGFEPGHLRISPRPDAANLAGAMRDLRADGVDVVVSLLEPAEAEALGLSGQDAACANAGITFLSNPIRDFGLPDRDTLLHLVCTLDRHMTNGSNVLVHCHAGIGRSGMTACALLVARGLPPQDALDTVSLARGQPVPDTPQQRQFVLTLFAAQRA